MKDTQNVPTEDGGPAFPASPTYGPNGELYRPADIGCEGMTLRDWFAGQALAGLIFHNDYGQRSDSDISNGAYAYADAMIAARKGGVK